MSLSVLPYILSGVGLLQNQDAQRKQNNAMAKAGNYQDRAIALQEDEYNNFRSPAFRRAFELANSYDPIAEARGSIQHASDVTKSTITSALKGLEGNVLSGGGNPNNSSEFRVRAQGMTNRAADPLRAFIAEATSNPTLKKIQAFQSIIGGSPAGSLTSAYFQGANGAASMAGPGGDFTGVARLLAQLIDQKSSKGAGGRGDNALGGSSVVLGNGWV